jgi:hypothetical protein
MEFNSATKKNEILSFASKWKELEKIILSKVGQAQKAKNPKAPKKDFTKRDSLMVYNF